jgi:hypothetical protein
VTKAKTDKQGQPTVDNETAASEGKIAQGVVQQDRVDDDCKGTGPEVEDVGADFRDLERVDRDLVLLIPVQALIGRLYTVIQRKFMAATDARLESVTEVIAHVKLIKFNVPQMTKLDKTVVANR